MAWIESHQSLRDHPKTRKLARILDISVPAAIGHLHCLWWWAMDYSDDGDISRHDALDIAIGGGWDDDPGRFVDALVAVGFLDSDDDHTGIHDWPDYGGKLTSRRKANAERMRDARAKENKPRATHVQGTQRTRAGLHNIHNTTDSTETTNKQNAPRKRDDVPVRLTYSDDFESFWQAYPSGHGVKKAAYEHWKRIKPDATMAQEILAGVHGWLQSDRWRRGYVMDAQRWLKDRAWESVPPAQTSPNGLTVHQGGNTGSRDRRKGYSADELMEQALELERVGR
jgi:hypothetical protein